MPEGPRPVELGGAREILGDRAGVQVFDREFLQQIRLQLELPEVVGEEQHAFWSQPPHGQPEQFWMVALYAEIRGPLGVGEGRGIEKNEVVGVASALEPVEAVGALQAVFVAVEAVELEVAVAPFQKARGEVHGGCFGRSALGGSHRGSSGVAEEVEETLALCPFPKPLTREAVVEEQPRVQAIGELHQEAVPTLMRACTKITKRCLV